jgi:hypothetical protein
MGIRCKEMQTTNERTKLVKQALKKAGYPVKSCHHDRGTAYHWIDITIDDYRHKIIDGKKIDQYEAIKKICFDIVGDGDQVVSFLKHHTCSECLISNCDKYHTPDMESCSGFFNEELRDLQEKEHQAYISEQERIKADPIRYTLDQETGTVYLQNVAVNCGATFTLSNMRYNDLLDQGKTKSQIFDYLAFEDTQKQRAKEYAKECEANREKLGHPWIYDGNGNRNNIRGYDPDHREKDPHKVEEILIIRAEGPCDLCGIPKYFNSFESASKWLRSEAYSFPETGGYDKHDFNITFVNGETYSGRLDCKHYQCQDNDLNLLDHVSSFMRYMAKNERITEEERAQYQVFIDQYLSLAEVI